MIWELRPLAAERGRPHGHPVAPRVDLARGANDQLRANSDEITRDVSLPLGKPLAPIHIDPKSPASNKSSPGGKGKGNAAQSAAAARVKAEQERQRAAIKLQAGVRGRRALELQVYCGGGGRRG